MYKIMCRKVTVVHVQGCGSPVIGHTHLQTRKNISNSRGVIWYVEHPYTPYGFELRTMKKKEEEERKKQRHRSDLKSGRAEEV